MFAPPVSRGWAGVPGAGVFQVDLAAGQLRGVGECDQLGPGNQVGGGQDDLEPGGVGLEIIAGQVGQAGGLGLADTVLDAGVLAVAKLQAGQLPGHGTGGGVGDERGHQHAVDVGEHVAGMRQRRGHREVSQISPLYTRGTTNQRVLLSSQAGGSRAAVKPDVCAARRLPRCRKRPSQSGHWS